MRLTIDLLLDLMNIYTRISYIKNTSFAFEAFMEESRTNRIVSENIAVHVWLNPRTGEPITVEDSFKNLVKKFEGEEVTIIGNSLYT